MGIQALFDMMSEGQMYKRVATGQNLSLRGLIDGLEALPAEMPVRTENGQTAGDVGSYRGYYSDLAIEPGAGLEIVGQLRGRLKNAIGETFQGYKGGDYVMRDHTPMWFSEYGCCGPAIHGLEVRDGVCVLLLKNDE